ncbi:MAG: putative two-component system histidine kinase [Amycolatopsis sp.]|nr:putative two-component system histidine kinase [Amycolatopsis sp.]
MAGALALLAVCVSVVSVVVTLRVRWSFHEALDDFVVSNLVIGLSFAFCGALIAWHKPGHPVGWMFAVGGNFQLITAACAPAAQALHDGGAPPLAAQIAVTVFAWAWPIHIGLMLPLSLYLLPDGRLPSPRWRPLFLAVAITAPLFVLEIGTGTALISNLPPGLWVLPQHGAWAALWSLSEVRWSLSMLLGLAALLMRYRRGDETVRAQLLWLLGAAGVILAAVVPWSLVAGTPIVVLFAIPLLPAAIAVSILRHGLLDIRLVLARGLSYGLLSGLVLIGYALLVLALSGVASALIVALLAFPLRARLQRSVERLLYGERDPLRVASRVGGRLTDLASSLDEVRTAMRLPWVAVAVGSETIAEAGTTSNHSVRRPLSDGAELVVGLRRGESVLALSDERVLDLLAGPLAVAVHASMTSRALQQSREQLVTAREEERLRLRRDLHDGLGPLLTGVALAADAAANLQLTAPEETTALLRGVRTDTRTAIAEVRRVVDDLRPPALAELGLTDALRTRAAQTVRRADGRPLQVTVDVATLGPLPAAIEVAAYRIATEALNNVVRHSTATSVRLHLRLDDELVVEVLDDGALAAAWCPGVGIVGMRERAAELGGSCDVGPSAEGGAVRARLPLVRT